MLGEILLQIQDAEKEADRIFTAAKNTILEIEREAEEEIEKISVQSPVNFVDTPFQKGTMYSFEKKEIGKAVEFAVKKFVERYTL
jgi:hypothetical protein